MYLEGLTCRTIYILRMHASLLPGATSSYVQAYRWLQVRVEISEAGFVLMEKLYSSFEASDK